MAVTNVSSKWVDGNLVFYDKSGNEIVTYDGTNRALTVHASAEFTAAGIAFHDIPTTDPGDSATIWSDSGVLKVAGAGG